ncbi:MAG: hypothetical protein OMM_07893 [Candidatus Magnetoglobus multicellularis str. Araruama]|uniref:Uncharacterized protein n=1 Tax=Candidatus Magnetoglobus multicellularis str. Araruama TaxID=890399 RepID=A0A1V1PAI7_9BACT|nr:MAG: hypothetical protein OMM_07893 [Candidatus Magnetoglobus multicellularis str. Araruama]
MSWNYNPHGGGNKIDKKLHPTIRNKIISYAESKYSDSFDELEVKFRGKFCYIQVKKDSDHFMPLARMRFFSMTSWSIAIFLYSNETYEPGFFANGEDLGTIEECVDYSSQFFF